mgnify:CR=1 FL=1
MSRRFSNKGRLIQADNLTITFWRALIPGVLISTAVLLFYRKPTLSFIKSPGASGIIFIATHSIGTLLFVVAIELTSIAVSYTHLTLPTKA